MGLMSIRDSAHGFKVTKLHIRVGLTRESRRLWVDTADVSIIGIRDVEKMEMHLAKLHRGIYSSARVRTDPPGSSGSQTSYRSKSRQRIGFVLNE